MASCGTHVETSKVFHQTNLSISAIHQIRDLLQRATLHIFKTKHDMYLYIFVTKILPPFAQIRLAPQLWLPILRLADTFLFTSTL